MQAAFLDTYTSSSTILITVTAVWFLFTARSVRLTFDPEVDSVSVSGGGGS